MRYPLAKIAEDTYEINEFDCASMFLVVGRERALLIDTGIGLGDLAAFVRTITPLPLDVLLTHNHRDHVGNAPRFARVHMSAIDMRMGPMLRPATTAESRLQYAHHTRSLHPERDCPWTDADMQPFDAEPEVVPIGDGHVFDLGGRRVTCVHTPGHTSGSLSAIDSQTGALFCGDACNRIIGLGVRPIAGMCHATMEEALEGLERLWAMDFDHARVYNGHTDFRMPGSPLDADVYPAAMRVMESVIAGDCVFRPKRIASIGADVEIVSKGGVELQFHRDQIHGKGTDFPA